jgi:hypothetical protein
LSAKIAYVDLVYQATKLVGNQPQVQHQFGAEVDYNLVAIT